MVLFFPNSGNNSILKVPSWEKKKSLTKTEAQFCLLDVGIQASNGRWFFLPEVLEASVWKAYCLGSFFSRAILQIPMPATSSEERQRVCACPLRVFPFHPKLCLYPIGRNVTKPYPSATKEVCAFILWTNLLRKDNWYLGKKLSLPSWVCLRWPSHIT